MNEVDLIEPLKLGGKMYVPLTKNRKTVLVRNDKLVFASFNPDMKLNIDDNTWDVEHIDGNEENCRLTNLRFTKFK